ncbi:hypothetical protein EGT07_23775 [Herbaspirillum sp. HC18]|nr:hypothetical protein EGT07_23775 [Herbaspirillum sp. HC18]
MQRPHIKISLICGLLLLFGAFCTFSSLLFLASQDAVRIEGVFVLSGFAMIQVGFGGALCEWSTKRQYFPTRKLPMHCVLGGCAAMLIGILHS